MSDKNSLQRVERSLLPCKSNYPGQLATKVTWLTTTTVVGRYLSLRDISDLVVLAGAGVERPAQEELRHHAAQGPHVDRLAERQP